MRHAIAGIVWLMAAIEMGIVVAFIGVESEPGARAALLCLRFCWRNFDSIPVGYYLRRALHLK
jgi:hypothetical protein